MRPLGWHEAHLFGGLAPAAMGKRVALMPIGLDAIGIEMHHQLADFAAGSRGIAMEGKARNTDQGPTARGAARTAKQPGLILAAAWVGGSVVGAHGVALAITEGSRRSPVL